MAHENNMKYLFAETALLPDGWATNVRVKIDDAGRVGAVEPESQPQAGDTVLTGRVLLPAPSNLHSHAFQRALAGRHNGKIAPGAWADFMALDGNALSIAGLKEDRLLDAWVFASKGQMVSDVWSAGRHMVKEGRHINRHGIEKRFRKTMRELRNLL